MKNDDSRSCRVRFSVVMGSKSTLTEETATDEQEEAFPMEEMQAEQHTLSLEGQGIIIYDKPTGEPSHVSVFSVT